MSLNICALFSSVTCCMFGPGLALRGPDGSMDQVRCWRPPPSWFARPRRSGVALVRRRVTTPLATPLAWPPGGGGAGARVPHGAAHLLHRPALLLLVRHPLRPARGETLGRGCARRRLRAVEGACGGGCARWRVGPCGSGDRLRVGAPSPPSPHHSIAL
eukprot:5646172-Prymnesium_polylepis.1